jgi:2-haloacid dehalogenase
MTTNMLRALLAHNALDQEFDHVLSTDLVATYKPDPRAYRLALDGFRLTKAEIAFAAFGGWDAAGAKSFGYQTFWANRLGSPVEELGIVPDAMGPGMRELVEFVHARCDHRNAAPG